MVVSWPLVVHQVMPAPSAVGEQPTDPHVLMMVADHVRDVLQRGDAIPVDRDRAAAQPTTGPTHRNEQIAPKPVPPQNRSMTTRQGIVRNLAEGYCFSAPPPEHTVLESSVHEID